MVRKERKRKKNKGIPGLMAHEEQGVESSPVLRVSISSSQK